MLLLAVGGVILINNQDEDKSMYNSHLKSYEKIIYVLCEPLILISKQYKHYPLFRSMYMLFNCNKKQVLLQQVIPNLKTRLTRSIKHN